MVVGASPAAWAAALIADRLGWETLLVSAGAAEQQIADYVQSCADSLESTEVPGGEALERMPVRIIDGPANPAGPFDFSGAALRDWAQTCLGSAGAVLSTAVLDPRFADDYRSADEVVRTVPVGAVRDTDLNHPVRDWFIAQSSDPDPFGTPEALQRLIVDGAQQGVEVDDEAVAARYGVLIPVGHAGLRWPELPAGITAAELALVTRPASRFGRLELLVHSKDSVV